MRLVPVAVASLTSSSTGGPGGSIVVRLVLNDTARTVVEAASVVLATGAASRWLGVEGEVAFQGLGVSSCATCDGFL